MPKRRFYFIQSVLSHSNDIILRWFLGVSAKVDGMPQVRRTPTFTPPSGNFFTPGHNASTNSDLFRLQFSELHDIRHALRMRQFYYYFWCSIFTVTAGIALAPFLSTDARPALIRYNYVLVYVGAALLFAFVKYTKYAVSRVFCVLPTLLFTRRLTPSFARPALFRCLDMLFLRRHV
jgi:hypothetical protein